MSDEDALVVGAQRLAVGEEPVRDGLDGERIRVGKGWDVAGDAGIGVVPPRPTNRLGFLVDAERDAGLSDEVCVVRGESTQGLVRRPGRVVSP
jgi:hypothetical protein